ncbi:MAG TPA: YCF48-related protein [Chthoniobacteraceae bacterium]|jgi:photosystem II stability/assembly factor-like uncharacterized protein|nr:YCF48-related protein [Chthoniobacteraceae bacterium]
MTRYEHVIEILDQAIGGPQSQIGVHGAFWRGLTRDQFVVKVVRGLPLLTLADGAGSNLVKALKGEAPFGADLPTPPPGARFSQMPAGFPPVAGPDIAFIQQWIDDSCPEDPLPSKVDSAPTFEWRPTNAPIASSRTDDIWFIDPQIGWAVNSNGQIVHTTDGGDTWVTQFQNEDIYFRCIGFADPLRGWCGTLTPSNRMFQTADGGATWVPVTLPANAPSAVCGLSVVNERVAYASGTNFPNRPARMMKTTDGGATWTAWEMAQWADLLVDCFFTDENTGWVVGGKSPTGSPTRDNVKAVVLFTQDGGRTWENRVASLQAQLPAGEWGWKIQFLNAQVGFISLENFDFGAILKTVDGGTTWVRLPINDPQKNADLEGVGFIDENVGWVGGWGDRNFVRRGSSATTDGGLTWQNANEIGTALNRFRFFGRPVTVGYSSGQTVYKYAPTPATPARAAAAVASVEQRHTPVLSQRTLSDAGACISFAGAPAGQPVGVRVWDRFGAEVTKFDTKVAEESGSPVVHWDLKDAAGRTVAPGQYILRLSRDEYLESSLLHLTT